MVSNPSLGKIGKIFDGVVKCDAIPLLGIRTPLSLYSIKFSNRNLAVQKRCDE